MTRDDETLSACHVTAPRFQTRTHKIQAERRHCHQSKNEHNMPFCERNLLLFLHFFEDSFFLDAARFELVMTHLEGTRRQQRGFITHQPA